MVDSKIKRRFIRTAFIATIGLLLLIASLITSSQILTWQLILGITLLLTGVLNIFDFIFLKKTVLRDKKLLFYALLFNPGLVSIFAGFLFITEQYPTLKCINISSVVAVVVSIIVSYGTFVIFILERKKNRTGNN